MQKRGITVLVLAVIVIAIFLFVVVANYPKEEDSFFLAPLNQPPTLEEIDGQIFVCEGSALSYRFGANDPEKDVLEFEISQKNGNPFYIRAFSDQDTEGAELYSGDTTKDQTGQDYLQTILVSDGQLSASTETKITVIEINNPPTIQDIGVQTIALDKSNAVFNKQVLALDTESGDYTSGNLLFSVFFESEEALFSIDDFGIINFTPDDSHVGAHDIRVCVSDKSLDEPHEFITLCDQSGLVQTTCEEFQLTITKKNDAPTISDFSPTKFELTGSGSTNFKFNISKFDPDETIPDTNWYADDILIEYDSGEEGDTLAYAFGCGVSGRHKIKAEITDGIARDSIEWNLTLERIDCPEGMPFRTDITAELCEEKWACNYWDLCQDADQSLAIGVLERSDHVRNKANCMDNGWENEFCGYQIRNCFDLNACNSTAQKSPEIQECYFTFSPSCSDNIRNCHEGSCEFLTDCGGPCESCATCFDKIKNSDEKGIDCGGSCSEQCREDLNFLEKESTKYILAVAFAIAALIIIFLVIKIKKMKIKLQPLPVKKPTTKEIPNKNQKAGAIAILIFTTILIFSFGVSAAEFEQNSLITGSATRCFPDYSCGEWGGCIEGLQSRTCLDDRCGRRDITERRFCNVPSCTPMIECLEWSECIYTEKINNFIRGEIGFGGYHNRICRDANGCVDSFTEEKPCEEFYSLTLEKVNQCDKELLALIDPASERIVAKINLDSWREDKLDITFTQGDKVYCQGCYNGATDGNEEGLDCGGDCKPCIERKVLPTKLITLSFWLFTILFSLLFIREMAALKKANRLTYRNILK